MIGRIAHSQPCSEHPYRKIGLDHSLAVAEKSALVHGTCESESLVVRFRVVGTCIRQVGAASSQSQADLLELRARRRDT